jgi:hypothetical protein
VKRKLPHVEVIDDATAAILRRMPGEKKIEQVFAMWRFARQTTENAVREQHPHWSDADVRYEVARRMSGGALPPRRGRKG